MSPEQCAKSGSEDAEQTALFCHIQNMMNANPIRYNCLAWAFAVPNGGSRGSTKKDAMIVGARLKATGVKAGVSDIFIPEPRHKLHGLFIEMKKSHDQGGGEVSDKQKEFGGWVQRRGYGFCVCYGWVQAWGVIEQWLDGELGYEAILM